MAENSINFLRDSLLHHRSIRDSLDNKASMLLAISGVIFGLSLARIEGPAFLALALSSFLTVFFSIVVISSTFRGNAKKNFGLMCWFGFAEKDFNQYKKELNRVFISDEKIADEYMKEIWNLANYSIKQKTLFLKIASFILIFGLLLSFIIFFFSFNFIL